MRKWIWGSRGMVQRGEELGEKTFHCHFLLYKFHKNSTLTDRLLTA